jgi:hypothetical protein
MPPARTLNTPLERPRFGARRRRAGSPAEAEPRVHSRTWHVALVATLLVGGGTARAQQTVTLRFQPPMGRVIETRTEMHTMTALTGFPSVPDGSTLEEEVLIGATQRVLGTAPDGFVVEVAVDSVRGRVRPTGGAWRDLVNLPLRAGVARAVVGTNFRVVGIQSQGTEDADLLQALGGFFMGLGFAFPSDPIAVGATVPIDGRVRPRVRTHSTTRLVLDQVMLGDLAITLDSVVHNSGDDLSYFEFRGEFAPRAEGAPSEGGGALTSYTGGFAGRFIWSSGWNAITAAAVRLRVEGRAQIQGTHGQQIAQVSWDRTVTHRLRP